MRKTNISRLKREASLLAARKEQAEQKFKAVEHTIYVAVRDTARNFQEHVWGFPLFEDVREHSHLVPTTKNTYNLRLKIHRIVLRARHLVDIPQPVMQDIIRQLKTKLQGSGVSVADHFDDGRAIYIDLAL